MIPPFRLEAILMRQIRQEQQHCTSQLPVVCRVGSAVCEMLLFSVVLSDFVVGAADLILPGQVIVLLQNFY